MKYRVPEQEEDRRGPGERLWKRSVKYLIEQGGSCGW